MAPCMDGWMDGWVVQSDHTVSSLTGFSCSGGSSSPQRGHGGEQDGVQLHGYALH